MTHPFSVEQLDNDDELNWVAPTTPGTYVLRYTVQANEGTFTDDLIVTVSELPSGPQTIRPRGIESQVQFGEPLVTVEPPEGAQVTYPGPNTYPGDETFPDFGLPPGPQPQTITPNPITSRALVGHPTVTVDPVPIHQTVEPESIGPQLAFGPVSVTVGAAPPEQPILDLTLSLFALDPDTGAGIALPDFESLDLSPQRNSGGSISLDYPPTGANFSVLRDAITNGRDVEVEIWTSGTAAGAMRGYLQEASGDDTAEEGAWTFAGGLLGVRMNEAVIEPQPLGPLVPDEDDDPTNDQHLNEKRELIFSRSTPGEVIATAMVQAHDRGVLDDIVWDFTTDADSDGVEWPQVISTKYSPGSTYKQILDRLVSLGLAEWDVVWDGYHRVLRMWVPEGRGEDLTLLDPPVVLRHGQNILDAPRKWSLREAGTSVLVAGSEGLYDARTDDTALARRGRKIERYVSAANLADDEAVTAYALNQLPVITAPVHEVTHGIGFLTGSPRPIVTYDVGDWVLSESGATMERLRVVQWSLRADADRSLSGTVTLNDTITDALVRLQARLDALVAGETVVGTSESSTPGGGRLDDITPPAAPENLLASSIAYQDPAHTNTLASVTVGWDPVQTNADGSNYPEVQAARHIIIRLEGYDPEREEDTGYRDDWTWEEAPWVVYEHGPTLRDEFDASGETDPLVWLQAYVDEFSATPTATDDVAGYHVRYAYIGTDQVGGLPSSDPYPDELRFWYEATPNDGITTTSWTWGGVEGGANIRIEVRAFDRSGNRGPWSAIGHDTAHDDTPPPRTTEPELSIWFRTLDVTWDGLGSLGQPMPVDFSHVEVWVSQSADFTPIASTAELADAFDPSDVNPQHVANLYAAGTHNQPDLPHGVGCYAALRAVDRAGNVAELSLVAGPATAEQLFPDDLRDQILNDSRMIAHETIGTAHIVDAAIINAKIADLAVNNAKIADLEVGKLRSGTMIAQVTVSGKFRTHASDAVSRVEFDRAGIRLYRGATVVGDWNVATGNMLVTGTYRSGLSGERINIHPDGTLRFYPSSGANYSQMSNVGSDVVWRGPRDPNGRSGRVNVNTLGVGMNYSAESEIPNRLRSEVVLFDRRTRITAPFQLHVVDGRYDNPVGGDRRIQFTTTSSSGTSLPFGHVNYLVSPDGRGTLMGNNAGLIFESPAAIHVKLTEGGWGRWINVHATSLVSESSRTVKTNIRPCQEVLDPVNTIRRARARTYSQTTAADNRPRIGVIAEELPEILLNRDAGLPGVDLVQQVAVLWEAVGQLLDEREGNA